MQTFTNNKDDHLSHCNWDCTRFRKSFPYLDQATRLISKFVFTESGIIGNNIVPNLKKGMKFI
jgi:hypothetical protein